MFGKYGFNVRQGTVRALVGILLGACAGFAQDFDVRGDASNAGTVLQGKNVNPAAADNIGVQGISVPTGYYGIGVQGAGGFMGVKGFSTVSSPNANVGSRYGTYGEAAYGQTNYGVYGAAYAGTGTNYGVFGTASGANSRAGYFIGDLEYTGALVHLSDRRLKKNFSDVKTALARVNSLPSPKSYDYRSDEFPALHLPATRQVGLIAQDVEAVFPDLVRETVLPVPQEAAKSGQENAAANAPATYKTVDYVGMIPYLIGAIQEQSAAIQAQAAEIARLKKRLGVE